MEIKGLDSLDLLLNDALSDIEMIEDLLENSNFVESITSDITSGFIQTWSTEGGSIGEDWKGHDLIESGRLRASLTNDSQINVVVIGDRIVFSSSVDYADYVNEKYPFAEISESTINHVLRSIDMHIRLYGKLSWTN